MTKFGTQPKAKVKPPVGVTSGALDLPETFTTEAPAEEVPKRRVGRPAEGVKGFATRLSPETIADIKALTDGLRLRSEGKAIERAVSFYKQHLLREVKAKLGDLGDEAELLRNAVKVD